MAIPNTITQEHILKAIQRIDLEGVPPKRNKRKWAIEYNGNLYPCKLVISWAYFYVSGKELDPNPKNFTTYTAQKYLSSKNFVTVPIKANNR